MRGYAGGGNGMKGVDTIRRIAGAGAGDTTPLETWGPPAHVLGGRPVIQGLNAFTSFTGSFSTGVWECSPGKWRVHYAEDALNLIVRGKAVIADENGQTRAVGPGDAFVIPAGFRGTWEVLETVRKVYAIHEMPAA